jgi:hypothetical protein
VGWGGRSPWRERKGVRYAIYVTLKNLLVVLANMVITCNCKSETQENKLKGSTYIVMINGSALIKSVGIN